ncbi:hypothetical protein [Amycolatopsis sp. GM8]|uniref:hypothetical protein n=1 Tax=Amycolatopsis sp. GM8 TaxID=2896530 RepID=UPI001F169D5D|nr:hypothetical protein [Amycolatopsis sp. GM8]
MIRELWRRISRHGSAEVLIFPADENSSQEALLIRRPSSYARKIGDDGEWIPVEIPREQEFGEILSPIDKKLREEFSNIRPFKLEEWDEWPLEAA